MSYVELSYIYFEFYSFTCYIDGICCKANSLWRTLKYYLILIITSIITIGVITLTEPTLNIGVFLPHIVGVDHSDLRRNAGSEAGPEGPAVREAADLRRHHGLRSDQETAGGHDGAVQQDVAQHPLLLHAPRVGWYPR